MTNWNYADVWETVADLQPTLPAVTQGPRTLSWEEFDHGADGVAQFLLDLDVAKQDKVAMYLYNCPEYLQSTFAAMKVGLVPVNTNYRYGDDELSYLWDNADAVAVIFHGAFAERIEGILDRVPRVKGWLWVDDDTGPCPEWATPYDDAAKSAIGRVAAPWGRSGDDLYMLYTGGTTGMPKGVMWRQDDLFARLIDSSVRHYPVDGGLEAVRAALEASPGGVTLLPACPLMHGTGNFPSNTILAEGGRVCLLESRRYDPVELLDTDSSARRSTASSSSATPSPGRSWPRSTSSRALGPELAHDDHLVGGHVERAREGRSCWRHHPGMLLVDAFSSSEALGMGVSVSASGAAAKTATFTLGPDVKVLTEDGRQVEPGSEEIGVLALGGRNPLGYYKDEEKSERTFKEIDGVRYSIPGDFAQVEADGTIHLLGRGSVCINSGGEKIFPEEVEEALKTHDAVRDAVVVGIPHATYGEQIVAVIELADGTDGAGGGRVDRARQGAPGRRTRRPGGCAPWRPSGGRRTARSTTSATRPSRWRTSASPQSELGVAAE